MSLPDHGDSPGLQARPRGVDVRGRTLAASRWGSGKGTYFPLQEALSTRAQGRGQGFAGWQEGVPEPREGCWATAARGPGSEAAIASWDDGRGAESQSGGSWDLGFSGDRAPSPPPSQRLTWIALSSFWKRKTSSGPFSMVGMWRCWGRQRREAQDRPSRPHPAQPELTSPWYRIACTGHTWQAVPEPKTSRRRPSASARITSFMVTLRSTTRNSPCRAGNGHPAVTQRAAPLRHPRGRRTPRGGAGTRRCAPAPPSQPLPHWPPTQQRPAPPQLTQV